MLKINVSLCFLLIFLSLTIVCGQKSLDRDPISQIKISPEQRARLRARFDLYVKYQIEKNYDAQFALIAPPLIDASKNCRKTSVICLTGKDEFISRQKEIEKLYGAIREVKIKDGERKISKNANRLTLTLDLKDDQERYFSLVYLEAFLLNGEWYFSLFYTVDY